LNLKISLRQFAHPPVNFSQGQEVRNFGSILTHCDFKVNQSIYLLKTHIKRAYIVINRTMVTLS